MAEAAESSKESPKSLEDRVSQPPTKAASTPGAPGPTSNSSKEPKSDLENAQLDGATAPQGGSALHDPQYDVEVKLSDIQGDASSPLYSISSFEELGM
jgi:ATP-dependent RNA helicase DDX19/DBP5